MLSRVFLIYQESSSSIFDSSSLRVGFSRVGCCADRGFVPSNDDMNEMSEDQRSAPVCRKLLLPLLSSSDEEL